jgi:thiol-disulfide isomerase/thioredoxin
VNALRLIAPVLLALSAGQAGVVTAQSAKPAVEAAKLHYYPEAANGPAILDQALAKAAASNHYAVVVFGADWCHDSRALAKALTSESFKAEFSGRFHVTFIDVGTPQTGAGHNLGLVKRLGVKNLKSTPALFMISPQGKLLNGKKDAVSWRNAESRGTEAIIAWFRAFDKQKR